MSRNLETPRSPVRSVVVNLGVLAVSYGILLVLTDLAKRGSWLSVSAAIVVGLACGIFLAWTARAGVAAVVLAGFLAALAPEALMDSVYGIHVILGNLPHYAMLGAGFLGVLLGALVCAFLGGGGALLARRRTDAPAAGAPAAPAASAPVDRLSRASA